MRISLQHYSQRTAFWFDEIKVYELPAGDWEQIVANQEEIDSYHIFPETLF